MQEALDEDNANEIESCSIKSENAVDNEITDVKSLESIENHSADSITETWWDDIIN